MARLIPCPICGKSMWRKSAMCQFCRWVAQQNAPVLENRKSSDIRRAGQKAWHTRSRSAPGLSYRARRRLLATWRKQGRTCVYCANPCQAIDHVLPLVLGGTNYIGNLVPACRRCNLSKADDLLIVWRRKRGDLAANPVAVQQLSMR